MTNIREHVDLQELAELSLWVIDDTVQPPEIRRIQVPFDAVGPFGCDRPERLPKLSKLFGQIGTYATALTDETNTAKTPPVYSFDSGLAIDTGSRTVSMSGLEIPPLTNKQFSILETLARAPKMVHSRESIIERVWGDASLAFPHTVDAHVAELRKRLGDTAKFGDLNRLIQTYKGVGFIMGKRVFELDPLTWPRQS